MPPSNRRISISRIAPETPWAMLAILGLAILAPSICTVWLANRAAQNEQLAHLQLLDQAQKDRLANGRNQLAESLSQRMNELAGPIRSDSSPRSWAKAVLSGSIHSALLFNGDGSIHYPNTGDIANDADSSASDSALAAIRNAIVAQDYTDADARIESLLGAEAPPFPALANGRSLLPIAALLGIDVAKAAGRDSQPAVQRLVQIALDYDRYTMPSAQRLFTIDQALIHQPDNPDLKALSEAETLASQWIETGYASSARLAYPLENSSAILLIPIPEIERILESEIESLNTGSPTPLKLYRTSELPLIQAVPKLELPGPISSWSLTLAAAPESDPASASLYLYIWIGVLVSALSAGLFVVTVILIRKQSNLTRTKNDLVATVTHELKTPISSIGLLVDTLIAKKSYSEAQVSDYLQIIQNENRRLGRLIENFLSYSRMERRNAAFELRPCSIDTIVSEALSAFRERFPDADYELQTQIEGGSRPISADSTAISTALSNLLENAYKYGGNPKRIRFEVKPAPDGAAFSVADNGQGIPLSEQKRVFRKFYQSAVRRSHHSGGVGLGLSIVQFIVSNHNGQISLASTPGNGCVFTISIPYA